MKLKRLEIMMLNVHFAYVRIRSKFIATITKWLGATKMEPLLTLYD